MSRMLIQKKCGTRLRENELGLQDQIQKRNCCGVPAARPGWEEAESNYSVRWHAFHSAQAAAHGISGGKRILGFLSAISRHVGERWRVPEGISASGHSCGD